MLLDLPAKPALWMPPAIIRAGGDLIRPKQHHALGSLPAATLTGFGKRSLYQILQAISVSANVKMCLDAGSAASYDPGVQTDKWFDLTSGGYDFFRGSGTGSDAADPTFNGTAGQLSSSEYWTFDTGDWFTYDTTNETWMQNLHKASAKLTMLGLFYLNAGDYGSYCGDNGGGATSGTGFHIIGGAGDAKTKFRVVNAGSSVCNQSATQAATNNAWNFVGCSVDEAAGAGGSFFYTNGTVDTFNGAYSSPSSGNASFTLNVGARGNGNLPVAVNNNRMACNALLDTNLSSAQMDSVFNAIRSRVGL